MSQEEFQREVEDAFRAAAPRTLARRSAASHRRHVSAATGGIAVHGNNNTVQVKLPSDSAPASDDPLARALHRFQPWPGIFGRIYSVICSLWLAASLVDISQEAGNILNVGDWVRAHGLFFLVQATVGSALLTATILVPYWLLSRLSSKVGV